MLLENVSVPASVPARMLPRSFVIVVVPMMLRMSPSIVMSKPVVGGPADALDPQVGRREDVLDVELCASGSAIARAEVDRDVDHGLDRRA